jgi:uncharacterized delta-60 repeat protein
VANDPITFEPVTSIALARYASTGALDTTFGNQGKVITTFSDHGDAGQAVIVDGSGNILVGANAGVDQFQSRDFEVVRFTGSGAVDMSFGTQGHVITDLGGDDTVTSMVLDGSGRIVVAGTTATGTTSALGLVRYSSGGVLDTTFGTAGKVITSFTGLTASAAGLAQDQNGHLLVAASVVGGAAGDVALARYSATDGSADATFGNGGKVVTDLGSANDSAAGLAVQANGRIVVTGSSAGSFALARYQGDAPIPPHVNQPPVNTAPGTLTLFRNGTAAFTGGARLAVADSDAGTGALVVTLTATSGTLHLASAAGLNSVTGNDTTVLTLTGNLTALNNALAGLSYVAAHGFAGTAQVTMSTNDQGNTGTGGPMTATNTFSVTVVDQAPVASPSLAPATTYKARKGKTLNVAAANGLQRAFIDPDGDPVMIKLVKKPAKGKLTLNADGSFTYKPAAGFRGKVTFTVMPSDGLLNGGVVTVTIKVA